MISEKTKNAILKLQERYPAKRAALIPALHMVQEEVGYLPLDVQREVAELFDIVPNEVNAVVTFYDMFHEEPVGKHIVHVCKNVSCMLRGADGLLKKMCQKLKVYPGGTSEDKEFTVVPAECLGACDLAPMMIVDDKVIGPVQVDQIDAILDKARRGDL